MISNFEKINFCNFSAHFSPHASPAHFPKFLPFQGATFADEFPSKAYGEIFVQSIVLFAKIPYFLVQISACPGVRAGRFPGGVDGEKFREFSSEASL